MKKPILPTIMFAATCVLAGVRYVQAADDWTLRLTPQGLYSSFSGSATRDYLWSYGAALDMQYLERGGVSLGAEHTDLHAKAGGRSISQNSAFVSGYVHLTPDSLPGRLTLRMDVLGANNNDVTNETDQVRVWAPQVSFMNRSKSLYLDVGYAESRYGDSTTPGRGSLRVRQWTPTVGIGFNGGADWLQLRLYDVRNDNALRSASKSKTTAVEGKWIHYFKPRGWIPEQLQLGVLGGERIYAVDPDTRALYNLSDLHKGGVTLGAHWKLGTNTRLMLSTGYNRFEAVAAPGAAATTYTGAYVYSGLSFQW